MKIVTHDSGYHTDDVFAVASLLLVFPNAEVIRSRDSEVQKTADILVDTGMQYDPEKRIFDHHQPGGAGIRDNGIPYASFGLVWKEFGEQIAGGRSEAEFIERRLVLPIDAGDNGVSIVEYKFPKIKPYDIGNFLNSFIKLRDPEGLNSAFMQAVETAKDLLSREVIFAKRIMTDKETIIDIYNKSSDKRLIILEEDLIGWTEVLRDKPEPIYVVHPRPDGHWTLGAIQEDHYVSRRPLPQEWAGLRDEDLQKVTGVDGALFCHKARFMASAQTKEGAIKLAEIALNS